jgi:hypothetical protein
MTEVPPADRYSWRASAETRAEERMTDTQARARAQQRNAGRVRFAGLMPALIVLGIYGITVHGDRTGTRSYTDRA